ncbi:hypothetical protein EGY25_15960 [Brevundimonas intermedia]|uniref:Uncharacterized protein n=1 Tax=Brevundimonas intermedia TaxID=74315 RepID=A0A4Y9RV31_9CAUL|nr:hypothetical protein [Brevundimonas intermedia]TFW11158.1 hypothetical protein EGY25_15960 [Brevundimonas intermedia]
MTFGMIILTGMLAMQQAPAPSAPTSPQAAPPTQAAPQRPRRICESRAPTGRRLEQRVCYTPEQYAAMVEAKRKEAEELQAGGNIQNDAKAAGG